MAEFKYLSPEEMKELSIKERKEYLRAKAEADANKGIDNIINPPAINEITATEEPKASVKEEKEPVINTSTGTGEEKPKEEKATKAPRPKKADNPFENLDKENGERVCLYLDRDVYNYLKNIQEVNHVKKFARVVNAVIKEYMKITN